MSETKILDMIIVKYFDNEDFRKKYWKPFQDTNYFNSEDDYLKMVNELFETIDGKKSYEIEETVNRHVGFSEEVAFKAGFKFAIVLSEELNGLLVNKNEVLHNELAKAYI